MSIRPVVAECCGGYLFALPLLLQIFFRHPFYSSRKTARLVPLVLMPVTVYLAISGQKARMWKPLEEFFHMNFSLVSFFTVYVVFMAFELGLSQEPPLSTKSSKDLEIREQERSQRLGTSSDSKIDPVPSWGELIRFVIWFLTNPRFLQTTWAPPAVIVPLGPQISLKEFFIRILRKTTKDHLSYLACWTMAVLFSKHPRGAYGFLTEKCGLNGSPGLALMAPYLNALPHAFSILFTIEGLSNIATLIELAMYHFGPKVLPKSLAPGPFDSTLYPPMFPDLWGQSTVGGFWSKGWHSAFRRGITFCMVNPVMKLCRPLGKICSTSIGAFFGMGLSAFVHEYVFISATREIDPTYSTSKVWLYSAVAIILERIYTAITGRKVCGILGKIWTYSFIFAVVLQAITRWMQLGLGQDGIQPVSEWSWYRYILPFGPVLPEKWISFLP